MALRRNELPPVATDTERPYTVYASLSTQCARLTQSPTSEIVRGSAAGEAAWPDVPCSRSKAFLGLEPRGRTDYKLATKGTKGNGDLGLISASPCGGLRVTETRCQHSFVSPTPWSMMPPDGRNAATVERWFSRRRRRTPRTQHAAPQVAQADNPSERDKALERLMSPVLCARDKLKLPSDGLRARLRLRWARPREARGRAPATAAAASRRRRRRTSGVASPRAWWMCTRRRRS